MAAVTPGVASLGREELAADVRENLGEFELARREVSGGEVLVSRMTPEALYAAHRWRGGRARLRSS